MYFCRSGSVGRATVLFESFVANSGKKVKKIELTSKEKGNLTELQCLLSFYELGHKVSIPYGENCRYDFILDVNGKLLKIQCKTSRTEDDGKSFLFSCKSTRKNNSSKAHTVVYTKEEIDYFATYYQGKCYLIPVEECGSEKRLRLSPPANGQIKKVSFAKDYELKQVLQQFA